jgi:hypothetical protein
MDPKTKKPRAPLFGCGLGWAQCTQATDKSREHYKPRCLTFAAYESGADARICGICQLGYCSRLCFSKHIDLQRAQEKTLCPDTAPSADDIAATFAKLGAKMGATQQARCSGSLTQPMFEFRFTPLVLAARRSGRATN